MADDDMVKLAERVEAATGADRELDALIYAEQLGGGEWRDNVLHVPSMKLRIGSIDPGERSRNFTCWFEQTPRYTASLDAAMTLVPEGALDHAEIYAPDHQTLGWTFRLMANANFQRPAATGFAATLPLALVAAALRAIATKGPQNV